MLEDPELFLSDKIVTIIISFVTVQSFCIARMVFRRLRNLLKPKLNCEKIQKFEKTLGSGRHLEGRCDVNRDWLLSTVTSDT